MRRNPTLAVLGNPASGPADADAARELELYIVNDGELYRQQHEPIIRNLQKKRAKGTYDRDKAVTLFMYLVENGAKKYLREFGTGGRIDRVFNRNTRLLVARELRDTFEHMERDVDPAVNPPSVTLRRAVAFFRKYAGHVVGRQMANALDLARAESYGHAHDWRVSWEGDPDADWSWMDATERKRDHEVESAVLRDRRGKVLASLGGIFDADQNYRRVVEAELMAEALEYLGRSATPRRHRLKRNPGSTIANKVLAIEYVHATDGKRYRHDFTEDTDHNDVTAKVTRGGRRVTLEARDGQSIVQDYR